MDNGREQLEELGARLDALSRDAKRLKGESSRGLEQSLRSLREQWSTLREELDAIEVLGGEPGSNMIVALQQSLTNLAGACAEAEKRLGSQGN
ncbi:MAG: hypothetical protein PVJ57_12980 [Phycisphaerae bacterium]